MDGVVPAPGAAASQAVSQEEEGQAAEEEGVEGEGQEDKPSDSAPAVAAPEAAPLPKRCAPLALPPGDSSGAQGIALDEGAVGSSSGPCAVALPAAQALDKLLKLAREIGEPRFYVGYAAFLLFALRFGVRPWMWEGSSRVDIVEAFLPPWQRERCQGRCFVDGVCTALAPSESGAAPLLPITEDTPLWECRHYVAGAVMDEPQEQDGEGIVAFYNRLGLALCGTVMDGDCAIDTMCMMLGKEQSQASRAEMRLELRDYLLDRLKEQWMQEVMVSCQEVTREEVEAYRSCGQLPEESLAVVQQEEEEGQEAGEHTERAGKPGPELLEALAWSTKVKDKGVLLSIAVDLSPAVREEQIRNHTASKLAPPIEDKRDEGKVLVLPHQYGSRMQVAKLYWKALRSCGWKEGEKEPYGARLAFLGKADLADVLE